MVNALPRGPGPAPLPRTGAAASIARMRTPSPRYLPAVLGLSLLLALAAPARGETARLTVLHTTDLHGALTAFDYGHDRPAARGLVRIASLVRAARAEGAPVLLLDGGDAIQGGALVDAWQRGDRARPEPMTAAMTRLGYDAMAVGNHEFSYGPAALAAARAASGFPWLAANVVGADGKPAFGASIVKELAGVRVGIVGLVTPAVPALEEAAHVAGLRFLPPLEAGNAEAKRLRESERCDLVIAIAHTGLERDPASGVARIGDAPDENQGARLAAELRGVDLLVLGHTHATVADAGPADDPVERALLSSDLYAEGAVCAVAMPGAGCGSHTTLPVSSTSYPPMARALVLNASERMISMRSRIFSSAR